mgnify:CR=1 FL=1
MLAVIWIISAAKFTVEVKAFIASGDTEKAFAPWLAEARIMGVTRAFFGDHVRISCTDCVINQPGCGRGYWHADWPYNQTNASHIPAPYPDTLLHLSTIWMLTDFTRENGATELLPMSHRLGIPNMWPDENGDFHFMNEQVKKLRAELEGGDPSNRLVAAEGSAGSAVVFLGGMWHRSGANVTADEDRVGVLTPYHARWVEPGWGLGIKDSLLKREVRDRMPAHVQEMSWHVTEDYPDRDDYPN